MDQHHSFQAEVAILAWDSPASVLEEINATVDNIFYRSLLQSCFAYRVNAAVFCLQDCTLREDGNFYGQGLYWNGDGFAMEELQVPLLLENRTELAIYQRMGRLSPEISAWLEKATLLNGFSKYANKRYLPEILLARGLGAYVIPTFPIRSFEDIRKGMETYRSCVVKPIGSSKGLGISFIENEDGVLYCRNFYEEHVLTEEFWKELSQGKEYILQPCMDFRNAAGNALHFRLLTSKGREGKWEPAMLHALVGATRFVSNGSHGGTSTFAEEILNREFGAEGERLIREMIWLCSAVPEALEAYIDQPISQYGIDVAVDRGSLQLYVIETNLGPASDYSPWHLSEKRARYYRHLLGRPITDTSSPSPLRTTLLESSGT